MIGVEVAYKAVEQQTAYLVSEAISSLGIPVNLGNVSELAEMLMPTVLEARRAMWATEARAIQGQHPGLQVSDVRFYPQGALERVIRRAAGLEPTPRLVEVSMFDEATQKMMAARMAPHLAPEDPAIIQAFRSRLSADLAVHVKQASRDTAIDTARFNGVRYARRLVGAENCAFCRMLASRGAVYTAKSSTRTEAGRAFHAHCDCVAEPVPNPSRWEGQAEADALYEEWKGAGGNLKEYRDYLTKQEGDDAVPMAA